MRKRQMGSWLGARAGVVLPFLFGALALGCSGTRLVSGGPFTAIVQTPEGTLRYSLSKSVVVVEATITEGASGKVSFEDGDFKVDTTLVRKDAKAEVSITTVVDQSQFFTLRLDHGSSADDSIAVEIAPNGLLRSVGAVSTSQAGSTIKNVVSIAASVVAGVAAAALGGDPKKEATTLVCEKLASDAATAARATPVPAAPPAPVPAAPVRKWAYPKTAKAAAEPKPAPIDTKLDTCADKRVATGLAEISLPGLFFLAKSAKHRRLWLNRRDAGERLDERSAQKAEIERSAGRASGKDLDDARARLAVHLQLVDTAREDLRTAAEDLDAAVRAFQRENGIDGPSRTEVVRVTLDLDDIPPPEGFQRTLMPDEKSRTIGLPDTDVRALLKPFPRMLELYDRTGIALSLTPPPVAVQSPTAWAPDAPTDPKTRIYFRPSYTGALTTYATARTTDAQGGQQDLLRFFAIVSDDLLHPKTPVIGFAFEPTIFAERKLALAFDEKGRLTRVEQSGRSSLAGATTAAVESVQLARNEYASTLAKLAEIQSTQRRMEQNGVLTEIDRLRKQRALLDARLELTGARSTYDLVLEKKRNEAELSAVESRRALAGEKDASAVSAEVHELRARLDQLTREMEELKARTGGTVSPRPYR